MKVYRIAFKIFFHHFSSAFHHLKWCYGATALSFALFIWACLRFTPLWKTKTVLHFSWNVAIEKNDLETLLFMGGIFFFFIIFIIAILNSHRDTLRWLSKLVQQPFFRLRYKRQWNNHHKFIIAICLAFILLLTIISITTLPLAILFLGQHSLYQSFNPSEVYDSPWWIDAAAFFFTFCGILLVLLSLLFVRITFLLRH